MHPDDRAGARAAASKASSPHLDEACIGSISEVFDAEPPFTPRGCIAQAWSVAEVLRVWVKLRARQNRTAGRPRLLKQRWHPPCDANRKGETWLKTNSRKWASILGDIIPNEERSPSDDESSALPADEDITSMEGGSQHGSSHHSGSRDVTEGVTGGTGTEVGGTRNFRQGTGATGGDIGNRPE